MQLLEPIHDDAVAVLADHCEVLGPSSEVVSDRIRQIEAVIVRGAVTVGDEMLAQLTALRVVARAGVGVDNIDLTSAAARGVGVVHVPHALTETVAEHALALALLLRRDIGGMAKATREGDSEARVRYAGDSIAGARVTVVGLGSIGQRTAGLFRALGADVSTWSRGAGGDRQSLLAACSGADVLSVHVALNGETRGLIDAECLDRLGAGAALVNTARPAVVDRAAILGALRSCQLGGYAVDGHNPVGPPESDELLQHPRVIVTPHTAALTRRAFRELCLATVGGVLGVLEGDEPRAPARLIHG
ncbi:MAG: NAD(P)-dependent oxidoreductase [Planctomycetota bacterium]